MMFTSNSDIVYQPLTNEQLINDNEPHTQDQFSALYLQRLLYDKQLNSEIYFVFSNWNDPLFWLYT